MMRYCICVISLILLIGLMSGCSKSPSIIPDESTSDTTNDNVALPPENVKLAAKPDKYQYDDFKSYANKYKDAYRVYIRSGNSDWFEIDTYMAIAGVNWISLQITYMGHTTKQGQTVTAIYPSFCSFDFSGSVEIKVEYDGKIKTAAVLPDEAVSDCEVLESSITFSLNDEYFSSDDKSGDKRGGIQLSVEINGGEDALHIFANELYKDEYHGTDGYTTILKFTEGYYDFDYWAAYDALTQSGTTSIIKSDISKYYADLYGIPELQRTLNYMASDYYKYENGRKMFNPQLVLPSNTLMYVDAGSVVNAQIRIGQIGSSSNMWKSKYVSNVKIYGHGVISILDYVPHNGGDYNTAGPLVYVANSNNITLEGVILIGSQYYCYHSQMSSDLILRNVKMFSHGVSGDGFNVYSVHGAQVTNCFFRTSDDAIAIYNWQYSYNHEYLMPDGTKKQLVTDCYDIKVEDFVYYGIGRAINIGSHGYRSASNRQQIYNVNISGGSILQAYRVSSDIGSGIIRIITSDENIVRDITVQDIFIRETNVGVSMPFRVEVHEGETNYGSGEIAAGYQIKNVILKNIYFNYKSKLYAPSIKGLTDQRMVSGVIIDGYYVNGKRMSTMTEAQIETNEFAYDINFIEN